MHQNQLVNLNIIMEVVEKAKLLGIIIKQNEPLSVYTTFRIGGAAKYFALAKNIEEIEKLWALAEKDKLPVLILGGGSNILINNAGFLGLVIKINNSRFKIKEDLIECEAGALLSKVMGEAMGAGLLGLEWAAGIPGTIGGAIRGNAGAYGGEMSHSVKSVKILRKGKIKELKNKDCQFNYRQSIFKETDNRDIILSAVLKLARASNPAKIEEAKERIRKTLKERGQKFGGFSAGSVFKNICLSTEEIKKFKDRFPQLPSQFVEYRKIPAAWLIDECGLRGRQIGGAKISDSHAGIIINETEATAEDVIMLISVIKQKVRSKFSIQLMEEIEYVGF
ncbi:MAG: UDP-N-acetylmuramate dehydrogenase [Patescibacteria group bacterium]